MQNMLRGEKKEKRERETLHPIVLDSPHLKTQLGQTVARSAVVAWGGEERSGRRDKDRAKTGHRPVCDCIYLFIFVEIMLHYGGSLPHQHTAAAPSGH